MGSPGHVNCTDNFNRQVDGVRDRFARRLGGRRLLLQHPNRGGQPARLGRALVAAGRLRPDEGDDETCVRVIGVPGRHRLGERVGVHRHPRARLPGREPLLDGHRPSRDPGGRASAGTGDGVPPRRQQLTKSFVEYRGYWLPHCFNNEGAIAEYWACREKAVVMDLSPLRKWEVLGPGRRDADPARDHARRAPARGRAGRLHGDVQRDRRNGRRRGPCSGSATTTSASSAATPMTASG